MEVLVPDYLADDLLAPMQAADPGVRLLPLSADGSCPFDTSGAEVLFKFFPGDRFSSVFGTETMREFSRSIPGLRWIHSGKAGVEDILIPELVESDVTLTNGAGGPKRAIAETVLAFILADAKALHQHFVHQRAGEWMHLEHRELPGLTVAILGLGRIGLEIARLCKALDLHVIGTKRTVSGDSLPNVDRIYPATLQGECVAQADYVVVASALTPDTQKMVDSPTLHAMRRDAMLINVSRGPVVDEEALLEALREGTIRRACLDVFVTEPLPSTSPFFDEPNAIVMPHNSPFSQNMQQHMVGIFLENFRRYRLGEPLLNVVDKRAGY
jgi:phosphoglycerate dehydrogenase-like enzyme